MGRISRVLKRFFGIRQKPRPFIVSLLAEQMARNVAKATGIKSTITREHLQQIKTGKVPRIYKRRAAAIAKLRERLKKKN